MRGFLQRCEVRLSTMHRVATALLSGAGILVLLPALERDAVLQVLRALLAGPVSWSRGLLMIAVALSIVLALVVLWLVVTNTIIAFVTFCAFSQSEIAPSLRDLAKPSICC